MFPPLLSAKRIACFKSPYLSDADMFTLAKMALTLPNLFKNVKPIRSKSVWYQFEVNVCRTSLSIKETKIVQNFLLWAIQYYPKSLRIYRNNKCDYTVLYSFSHCEEGGSLPPTHYSDKGGLK
jgi:hypothetical protein